MMSITDLTEDILVKISEYLPKTSKALLAVALTAPAESWLSSGWNRGPSPMGRAIVGSVQPTTQLMPNTKLFGGSLDYSVKMREYYNTSWEILDFCDVCDIGDQNLAVRLEDNDVASVLLCIGAKDKLKTLRLSFLMNFRGHGLEPVIGSTVLEFIEMDLPEKLQEHVMGCGNYGKHCRK